MFVQFLIFLIFKVFFVSANLKREETKMSKKQKDESFTLGDKEYFLKDVNLNATAKRTDGAWQFLFNPSELGLTASPEYSKSETWGVMDAKEAGYPLQFNRMKNPQLKFNNIKLNGYVFGRQVEDLEQGLFKLMMTAGGADNGASAGPQVLEFVWGKKTFGPCVIKDISITEKMWDNGLLVNADLNFTLEKIPEWTVNDGQVSVYAPGTQGTQPTQTAPESQNNEEPDEEEKPDKEDKPAARCLELRNAQQNAVKILDKTFEAAAENKSPKPSRLSSIVVIKNRIISISNNTKNVISSYNEFLNSVTKADSSIYNTKCAKEVFSQQYGELISISNSDVYDAYTDTIEKSDKIFSSIRTCSNDLRKALKAKFDAGCSSIGGGNAGGAQSTNSNAPAYIPPYSQQNQ